MTQYQINPQSKSTILRVGNECTPVIIIDDFLLDTQGVINEARAQNFQSEGHDNFYPGIRAHVGQEYGMALLKAIAPIFYNVLKIPQHLTLYPKAGSFSLLNQPEETLNIRQCIPHFDNNITFSFAILHYLNPGDFGGTAIYRHIPTGYENITAGRKEHYFASLNQFIAENGTPEKKYFSHGDQHYELIEKIDYRANRLVIYPSTILHSAFIEHPEQDVCNDVKTGRLTANFFIEFS